MNKAIPFVATVLFAVSACGGSSGGKSARFEASPVRVFADDSGVGKVRGRADGEELTGYILTPELALVLDDLRDTRDLDPVDTSGIATVGSGPNTVIREGAVSQDGLVLNVLEISTLDEDASVVLFEEPTFGDTLLLVAGTQATDLPVSGRASYSGVLGIQDLLSDSFPELGTFTATADFGNASPAILFDGSTSSYSVSGRATVSGDSFSSTAISIRDVRVGSITGASLNGDFHGDRANSIAGVIYSNDSFGDVRGGFVGSQ